MKSELYVFFKRLTSCHLLTNCFWSELHIWYFDQNFGKNYFVNYSPDLAKERVSVDWFCIFAVFIQSFVLAVLQMAPVVHDFIHHSSLFLLPLQGAEGSKRCIFRLKCWLIVLLLNCTLNSSDSVSWVECPAGLTCSRSETTAFQLTI